ncbi:MAG: thioredoxin [Bacteroidales bacterium]
MKGNFDQLIASELPVITDFYAEWCSPCKTQAPILQELAMEMRNQVRVIKIDVDKNPEVAARFRVQAVPTLMIFRKGQVRFRHSGLLSKPQLSSAILKSMQS